MSDGWRYIAQRFDGNSGGLGDFIDFNVPLSGVNLEEVLSGHNALSGTITPEYVRLKASDGRPILEELGTAIWAEAPDGEIRGGGLLTHSGFDGPSWAVECTDLSVITLDLPFTEGAFFVNADPLDIFRYIWRWIQSQPNSNLGVSIDPTTSPVRLGNDLIQRVEFDLEPDVSDDLEPVPPPAAPNRYANNAAWRDAAVKALKGRGRKESVVDEALGKWLNKDRLTENGEWTKLTEKQRTIRDRAIELLGLPPNPPNGTFIGSQNIRVAAPGMVPGAQPNPPETPAAPGPTYEVDPYKLNWYTNIDLSRDIDDLATRSPFDWHMTHRWVGDEIHHHIRLGYPRLGRRRDELRFVVGENIRDIPSVERDGSEYANEVLVLGAGEGSAMIMGRAFRREDGRIRKVKTISDPSIQTVGDATARAEAELAKRFNIDDIREIRLTNHPHAPMGSVDLGDEILIEGELGWVDLEVWCRVVARTMSPDDSDTQTLTVIRSDRMS